MVDGDLCCKSPCNSGVAADRLHAEAEDRLGLELVSQGKIEAAVAAFERASRADPLFPNAHLDRGAALRLAGRRQEAIDALRTALTLRPRWPAALYNMGTNLMETGDLQGALAAFEETVMLQPDYSLAFSGLGMVRFAKNDLDAAKASLRQALALDPDLHIASHYLGQAHQYCNEAEPAIEVYQEALRRNPAVCQDCHLSLGLALLATGRYAEGWDEYEWRWRSGGHPVVLSGQTCPLWDGSPLAGRSIVLWAEQGIGDILQFVRFASHVARRGGVVHLLSRPNLDRLLATCPGVSRVASKAEELGDFDFQLPLASLPRALGIGLTDLPAAGVPYLAPPLEWRGRDPFGPRRGDELRVGLVWAVEKGQPNWEARSCPLARFRALESVPGATLYSLQFGPRRAELRQPDAPRAVDLSAVLGDFARTAAFVAALDVVITVDTSMAHLAGALGKRVWTLLGWEADWRWLHGREDSPWYPTMRLFRQPARGQWDSVMEAVAHALRELRFQSFSTPMERTQ